MSRHWNPGEDLGRAREAQPRNRWPEGATAGVTAVAIACAGLALILYKLAGPRDIFGS